MCARTEHCAVLVAAKYFLTPAFLAHMLALHPAFTTQKQEFRLSCSLLSSSLSLAIQVSVAGTIAFSLVRGYVGAEMGRKGVGWSFERKLLAQFHPNKLPG